MATQLMTTREVFDHHIQALGKGDIDDLLSDYTNDSIVIGPDGVVKGLPAIRATFGAYLSGLLKPGTYEFSLDKLHVEGDTVLVMWHAKCMGADITFAADTFIVRNGKIAVQTFAPQLNFHA